MRSEFEHRREQLLTSSPTLAILVLLVLVSIGCTTRRFSQVPLDRFEYEEPQMGVPFRMVVYATNEVHAERAVEPEPPA